jgi:putative chitinase
MATFDRDVFFAQVRDDLFSGALSQQQVDGMNLLLAMYESGYTGTPMNDVRWLAYILATVFHECATTMWPITEYGSQEYLTGKEYWPYIGRGFVMITWEDNYRHASAQLSLIGDRDLVDHPELALDSLIASRILFRGCAEGWFTGKKLGQYFDSDTDDPVNARQIVNGNDDDELIAGYHRHFLEALQKAQAEVAAEESVVFKVTVNGTGPFTAKVEEDET